MTGWPRINLAVRGRLRGDRVGLLWHPAKFVDFFFFFRCPVEVFSSVCSRRGRSDLLPAAGGGGGGNRPAIGAMVRVEHGGW